ncbi:MAG: hypothetical protein JST39_05540 [Bacteroidetes bacterium]|nr:hypothetical protein [Bacteroidota bacterium]
MRDNERIEQQVQQAMNSLDGIQKAGPGPFFFTRVQARLQRQNSNAWDRISSFITRPTVALGGLCIIILLNAVAFYLRPAAGNASIAVLTAATGETGYTEDYGNLATNFFYDENPEP